MRLIARFVNAPCDAMTSEGLHEQRKLNLVVVLTVAD